MRTHRVEMRRFCLAVACLAVVGCISPPQNLSVGGTDTGESPADIAGADGLIDLADLVELPDAQGDTDLCDCPDTQVCLGDGCVDCVVSEDCSAGVCEPMSNTCVECIPDSVPCSSESASRCTDEFECAACEDDMDCANFPGLPACVAGRCVECSSTNVTACGALACNPRASACTMTPAGALGTCRPCVTDAECSPGRLCVAMKFQGEPRGDGESGYCLPLYDNAVACEPGTLHTLLSRDLPSLDDMTLRHYCAPNQNRTTCEAMLDWGKSCSTELQCGAVPGDAVCAMTLGLPGTRCTYPCDQDGECLDMSGCGDEPKVCGRS